MQSKKHSHPFIVGASWVLRFETRTQKHGEIQFTNLNKAQYRYLYFLKDSYFLAFEPASFRHNNADETISTAASFFIIQKFLWKTKAVFTTVSNLSHRQQWPSPPAASPVAQWVHRSFALGRQVCQCRLCWPLLSEDRGPRAHARLMDGTPHVPRAVGPGESLAFQNIQVARLLCTPLPREKDLKVDANLSFGIQGKFQWKVSMFQRILSTHFFKKILCIKPI